MINNEGYNVDYLKTLSKNDYVEWYFAEMKRVFPYGIPFISWNYRDAEFSYNEIHSIKQ